MKRFLTGFGFLSTDNADRLAGFVHHRMAVAFWPPWSLSGPIPSSEQGQFMQAGQGHAHLGFEYLQAWRLSGQPVLLFDHPQIKKKYFLT